MPADGPSRSRSGTARRRSSTSRSRFAAGPWSRRRTGSPTPTLSEQWQRCDSGGGNCVDIGGATGSTYQLVGADVGSTLRTKETATNTAAIVPIETPKSVDLVSKRVGNYERNPLFGVLLDQLWVR